LSKEIKPPKKFDFVKGVQYQKLRLGITTDDTFKCKTKEFTNYYKFDAVTDMQYGVAKTLQMKYKGIVIGYISLATGSMLKSRSKVFRRKEIGSHIPALLISHLATRKGWEKKGIASILLKIAIEKGKDIADGIVACRIIMLNPYDSDSVREFYKNRGFTYISHKNKNKDICFLDLDTGENQSGVD